jgi:hypothetical protein
VSSKQSTSRCVRLALNHRTGSFPWIVPSISLLLLLWLCTDHVILCLMRGVPSIAIVGWPT